MVHSWIDYYFARFHMIDTSVINIFQCVIYGFFKTSLSWNMDSNFWKKEREEQNTQTGGI